jgi:L-aminopeptidase/D-esterase-like protein
MRAGLEPLPEGFAVGHWSDHEAETGCTVVLAPPGSRGGVDIRGGGASVRETEVISPLANAPEATAVVLTGGSAFGLAAADGVARWLEDQGRGYATPAGIVPIVPAAVVYDLASGRSDVRPDAASGRAACDAAAAGVPERGRVGAGTGATVGKVRGRDHCSPGGLGYAGLRIGTGHVVAAVAAVNAAGDVIGEDGRPTAGLMAKEFEGSVDAVLSLEEVPELREAARQSSTLVCVVTDASLSKADCTRVARMASAGIARAVAPVFTPVDGDVCFCLASGREEAVPLASMAIGTAAAEAAAAAIRDAVAPR